MPLNKETKLTLPKLRELSFSQYLPIAGKEEME